MYPLDAAIALRTQGIIKGAEVAPSALKTSCPLISVKSFVRNRMCPSGIAGIGRNYRIRASRQKRLHGALKIGWIKSTIAACCQLGHFLHHADLVLFGLRT